MDERGWVRISAYLFFSILLLRARKDLRGGYTVERWVQSYRLPVFDGSQIASLLEHGDVQDYLAGMLTSFTRVGSTVVYFRHRGRTHRRSFSDMDMDDMVALSQGVEPEYRFAFFKRIADTALFLTRVFLEHVAAASVGVANKPRLAGRRAGTIEEYQNDGLQFCLMAAECASARSADVVSLGKIADNFDLVRKPLNLVSERYIPLFRFQWFAPSL
ncbi:MAG: hypothetical protein QGH66_06760 [Dehalococcoidia bacterium]|jgi:hypothetical protein|nr:hypothetical protein [Dehalococcoidia bacterium]MDP7240129.1 hypothetical protein [Dehalococcoidia bacterium]